MQDSRFNSKMVRLKGAPLIGFRDKENSFQFQNGSIKRAKRTTTPYTEDLFQFQNGSIKSENPELYLGKFHPFQFQNGSIKSLYPVPALLNFSFVSIPKWFD